MSYNYCFMWNLHNINENFKLLFNQLQNLSILRVDFNFSLHLKDNKTNSGKIICQGNRFVLSVPSLTLRAITSHFSAQPPNLQVVPREGECSQLRHYSSATVQPENIKIHRVREHLRDECYARDERDSYFMKLYSPPYFCIVPLALLQTNHFILKAVTVIPQPSFLLKAVPMV